jgi:hypothetical protein
MSTLDDRLHDLGETLATPRLPDAPAVMARGRQRRHRRRARLAAGALVVGTGTGLAGFRVLGGGDDPDVRTTIVPPGDGGPVVAPPSSTTATALPSTSTTAPSTTTTTTTTTTGPPSTIVVPDVVGLRVDEARVALEHAGFLVRVLGDGGGDATVVAQSPAAGANHPVGGEVRIQAG